MSPRGFSSTSRAPSSVDYDAIKKNAYRDQDILIVNVNDTKLPWQEREILMAIGERLYGKPSAGKHHGREQQ